MDINFRISRFPKLNVSLSRVQTFVGLAAGILSITGALVAFLKPAPDKSELVAIVQDGKTVVSDATIEILTPGGALITTLTPDWSGKARYRLNEGHYRLRISHPRYRPEFRDVQLISQQSTEVRIQLRSGTSFGDSMRRLIHH